MTSNLKYRNNVIKFEANVARCEYAFNKWIVTFQLNFLRTKKMYENLFKSPLQRVFVYGTLKRGEPNYSLIANKENGYAKFIGLGKTILKYPLIVTTRYNVPFVLKKPGTGNVCIQKVFKISLQSNYIFGILIYLKTILYKTISNELIENLN